MDPSSRVSAARGLKEPSARKKELPLAREEGLEFGVVMVATRSS